MTYKAEFKSSFVKLTDDDNNNLAYIPYRSIVKIDAKVLKSNTDLVTELCITVLQNTTYDVTLNSKEFSIFEGYMTNNISETY